MAPVSVVVVGAGQRGTGYARWVLRHPERASVVAVAEPREARRARCAADHDIPAKNAVADWRQLAGAVATGNRDLIMSGPRESLASHLAVFAAERARLNGTVETIPPPTRPTSA